LGFEQRLFVIETRAFTSSALTVAEDSETSDSELDLFPDMFQLIAVNKKHTLLACHHNHTQKLTRSFSECHVENTGLPPSICVVCCAPKTVVSVDQTGKTRGEIYGF